MEAEMLHLGKRAIEVKDLGERPLDIGCAERKERYRSGDRRADDLCQSAPDWMRHVGLVGHVCSLMIAGLIERPLLMERYWLTFFPPTITTIVSI
jgi:hypothetical protein